MYISLAIHGSFIFFFFCVFAFKQKEWDCKLCTAHNKGEAMVCSVCHSPRLIMLKKSASFDEDSMTLSADSNTSYTSPKHNGQYTPPRLAKMSELDVNSAAISVIYGDTTNGPVSPALSAGSSTGFDWSSVDANDKLNLKPSPDGGDIDSTKKDFVRILTTIESNIINQDPLKLFDDLSKVAKRLQRKDPKYRTLDLKNPVVQERYGVCYKTQNTKNQTRYKIYTEFFYFHFLFCTLFIFLIECFSCDFA